MQKLIKISNINEEDKLLNLLDRLEEKRYEIHDKYGNYIYDIENSLIIDTCPTNIINVSLQFVESIYDTSGLFMIIDFDKKIVGFSNWIFLGIMMSKYKKEDILSLDEISSMI